MPISAAATPYLHLMRSPIVFIELLTITNINMVPLYVANSNDVVTSRGFTFRPSSFEIILPAQDPEEFPNLSIRICNVDPAIMEYLRAVGTAPTLRLDIVTDLDLNNPEITIDFLKLKTVTYNSFEIVGSLMIDNWLGRKFGDIYDPVQFPGLFAI